MSEYIEHVNAELKFPKNKGFEVSYQIVVCSNVLQSLQQLVQIHDVHECVQKQLTTCVQEKCKVSTETMR